MSQEVQGMLIQIEATTAQLRREMAKADGLVASSTKKIDAQLSKVDHAFDRMNVTADGAVRGVVSGLKGIVAPALAAASALSALSKGVDVQREFDRLNAGLITATGSSEKAAVAFEALREFAQKTPYDLGQAVEGFTKLVNLGLTPSEQALMSYGNTASSMGKDLNQMIEAVADAATGEFERLKEFGIKASKEGGRVSLTFQGVTTRIGNNAAEIEKYLIGLGENQFAGAMELRMQTLDGAIANLGDTWDQTFRLINDAGAGELMRGAVVQVVEALDELNAMLASGELEGYLDALGGKFDGWGADIETTLNTLGEQFDSLFTEMSKKGESDLALLTDSFRNFPENVRAFVQLMTVEVLSAFDKASAYAVAFKDGVKALFSDDTLTDVNARLQAELGRLNGIRDESISAILSERDAAVGSYEEQLAAAAARRAAYEEERKARAKDTADRLAQFKVEADGQDGVTDATGKNTKALNEQAKAIDSVLAKALPEKKRLQDLVANIQNLQAAHAKGKITALELGQGIKTLNEEYASPAVQKRTAAEKKVADQIKAVDDAVRGVLDRLDPAAAATRKYREEQDALQQAMKNHPERADEYRAALDRLGVEYENNRRAASQWGQFTERALDSVDQSFADAWKNIGKGFDGFADGLKNAFKNLLAELAHLAITRPIVMQIGAALGVGGMAGQSSGLFGMLGGGSGGGMGGITDLFGYAKNAYSLFNSGFGQAVMGGWNSGGLTGAISGGWGYGSNAVSGLFGAGSGATQAGYTGAAFANWVNGGSAGLGATQAGYTGAAMQNWVALQNAGNWGTALTGTGAMLGGLGGALYGYGKSGLKGAVAGGLGGWGGAAAGGVAGASVGAAIGGTLGSVLPGIGTAIGAALGSYLGGSLFGGAWQTKDVGLALSVNDGEFLGQNFEYQKKKGGLFSSNKKRTRFSALDPEIAEALQGTFDATADGVFSLFEGLSYTVEDSALSGLRMARKQISTKGKTEEQIQEAIAEWFGKAADAMTAELQSVFGTGLDLDFAGMQAFVGNLKGVNEVIRYLNVGMFDASVAGGKLAESLSAAAGGLEALATNSQTYYGAFFTDAEKVEDTIDSITRAFESADVTLAGSRAEYRAMVEDIDLTTEAGQELFATLMALSGQAAAYFDIVEQQAAQANALLIGSVNSAYAALQRSIAAQQREVQQSASQAAANINALSGVSNALDAALKKLRGSSDATTRMLRAQATMTLNSALVTARAGGSLAGFAGLQDALDVASEMDTALYSTLADFEREQGRTANLIAELEKVNGKQLSIEQRMLEKFEQQLSALDRQLAFAQSQLDALNGIDNSIMGVAAAIAAMNASVVAALQSLPKDAAKSNTPQNNRTIIDSIYQSVLGRGTAGDEAGAAFWANALQNGTATYQDIAASIAKGALSNAGESAGGKKSAEEYLKSLGIPGFALGGDHFGGAAIVGERGPELMVTGPARIYNANKTADMLSGTGTAQAIERLERTVERQGDALRSIAKHTMQTARRVEFLERWDVDGLPPERAIA